MGIKVVFKEANFSTNGFPISGGDDPTPSTPQAIVAAQVSHAVVMKNVTVIGQSSSDGASSINRTSDTRSTLLVPAAYAAEMYPEQYNDLYPDYSALYLPAGLQSVTISCDAVQSAKYGLCLQRADTLARDYDSGWVNTGNSATKTFDAPTTVGYYLTSTFDKLIDKTGAEINYTVAVTY